MVINEKVSKIDKFVKVLFVASIISSHVITEWSIILPKYSPFWQLHAAGFQI